ncbi:RNA methyltransferase [bacterium]|nr:RNA methyltransferase [bacterium]
MKDKNFWIWGKHSVEAVLENYPESILEFQMLTDLKDHKADGVESLVQLAQDQGIKIKKVANFPKDYGVKRHQGVLLSMKAAPVGDIRDFNQALEVASEDKLYQWALLDRVEDPRNFGAILRSAAAFGLSGVIFGGRNQAPVTGVVAQASAGQCFRVAMFELGNTNQIFRSFDEASEAGQCEVAVASLDMDGQGLQEFAGEFKAKSGTRHVIWVLGSEGRGVRPGLLEKSSHKVSIPMEKSVESLNVSVASALAFYALYSQ